MKSSEILREAAMLVENGGSGLYASSQYNGSDAWDVAQGFIDAVMPPRPWQDDIIPMDFSISSRAMILCLAAAIAESEGD